MKEQQDSVHLTKTLFARMEDGHEAQYECEEAIAEILGVKLLGIGWDGYDSSFEIFPLEDVADVAPTPEQHERILALGCSRYWINFPDDTQRYGMGRRTPANGERRWQKHNSYRDERRGGDMEWVQRIRETAAHLRDNSLKLAKYPGMAEEARARELAALYIAEIADLHEAKRRIPTHGATDTPS